MNNHYNNKEYIKLVRDILEHDEFQKLSRINHHGSNRLDHSIRVSYWAYRLGKLFKLDYKKIARGALLHDFFFEDNTESCRKEKTITMLKHPEYALENANKHFELSDLEKDIILTHMFPIVPKLPKYIDSWMVDIVDDVVAVYEKSYVVRKQLSAATSFLLVFLINYLR